MKTSRSSSVRKSPKYAPPGNVPREYEALQFCLVQGERDTQGHNLLVGLSALSRTHMLLKDVLLRKPDSLQESPPLILPWHESPYLAPTTSDALKTSRDQRTPEEVSIYLMNGYRYPQ
jgi:hypothetical protein